MKKELQQKPDMKTQRRSNSPGFIRENEPECRRWRHFLHSKVQLSVGITKRIRKAGALL